MFSNYHAYHRSLSLFMMLIMLAAFQAFGTEDQVLQGLTAQSLGTGLGAAAPASAYNTNTNEYLVIFAKNDVDCSKLSLYGSTINAFTGAITNTFKISSCWDKIENLQITYNKEQNEYFVGYNAGSFVYAQFINGLNMEITLPIEVASVSFGDPFERISLSYATEEQVYGFGYHTRNSSTDKLFTMRYFDQSSKALLGDLTELDKNLSSKTNNGVEGANLLYHNGSFFVCFELEFETASEIWGTIIDPATGILLPTTDNGIFQISNTPTGDTVNINPSATINSNSGEILVAYEKSHQQITTAAINKNIFGRVVNPNTWQPVGNEETLSSIPNPDNDDFEDAKLPIITFSEKSNEYLIHFYGRWWVNSSANRYHHYIQRIDASYLSLIGPKSIKISDAIGVVIEQNNSLAPLALSNNNSNNQFLTSWIVDATNEIKTQIWRYDNNPPANLRTAIDEHNETLAIGQTFTTIDAEDPDPEDLTISFELVAGTGDDHNSYFTIVDNQLQVAKKLDYETNSTMSVRLRAKDTHGAYIDKASTLSVIDVNEAPYRLSLDGQLEIMENSTDFTASIIAEDEDIGDTHSFKLVSGDSASNNEMFEISGNQLALLEAPNFEDTSSLYVRIQAEDQNGLYLQKAFTIQVLDVNEPIDTIYLSPGSLSENDANAFSSIIIEDPDHSSDYTLTFTAGDGGEDNAYFSLIDNTLIPRAPLNFEEKETYYVKIQAKEGTYSKAAKLVISVIDVNDPPDSIALSSAAVMDGKGSGYGIGKFSSYDQDEGDDHSYRLIAGGETFGIDVNDSLYTKRSLIYDYADPESNFYLIEVESKDSGDSVLVQSFTIEVVPFSDTKAPVLYNFDHPKHTSDQQFIISIDALDNEELDTAFAYYRGIRASDDEPFTPVDDLQLVDAEKTYFRAEATLSISATDDMGIEYYFKVLDASGNADSTSIAYTYVETINQDFKPTSLNYKGDEGSYRIIANPYLFENNSIVEIFSDYGASSEDTWRLFTYETASDKNREIGNTPGTMKQGVGYWFNKASNINTGIKFDKALSPENNRENQFVLSLSRGWNMIGNPYPFELKWNQVLAYNNADQPFELFGFNGSYRTLDILQPFFGGFVYSNEATNLIIPVARPSESARIAKNSETSPDWLVQLILSTDQTVNGLSGFGMHKEANNSYDYYDRPLLPRFGDYSDIAFEHPEHFSKAFSKDIVPDQEQYVWEFVVSSSHSNQKHLLSWDPAQFRYIPHQLVLYDIATGKHIDMRQQEGYALTINEPRAFKAIYGDQHFIKDILKEMEIEKLRPFPNPFENQVFFPLTLPESKHNYDVECNLYDLLGHHVLQVHNQNVGYGNYDLKLTQTEDFKEGIYIYSIKIKNKYLTKEFHGRVVKY